MNSGPITVRTKVEAPIYGVWMLWTTKEHIKQWNNATPDWHTPKVKIKLEEEGSFRYRMAAKDGSASFDFEGVFDTVDEPNMLSYTLSDGRKVSVKFKSEGRFTAVLETFDPESENSPELQKKGWQAILDNFKNYAEEQLSEDEGENSKSLNNRKGFDDDDES